MENRRYQEAFSIGKTWFSCVNQFIKVRRAHSVVASAINTVEVHGLDVCPDDGIDGFKRYVALAVLARNIHRIGAILWHQDSED